MGGDRVLPWGLPPESEHSNRTMPSFGLRERAVAVGEFSRSAALCQNGAGQAGPVSPGPLEWAKEAAFVGNSPLEDSAQPSLGVTAQKAVSHSGKIVGHAPSQAD
jgi:hypothetical protein